MSGSAGAHRLAVRDGSAGELVHEVDELSNLSVGHRDPLVNEGSVLVIRAEESGVRGKAGNCRN